MRQYRHALPRAVVNIASLACIIHSAIFTWRWFLPAPWWDDWAWVEHFRQYSAGHFTVADLFSQHNEHRIVTTRLVLLADSLLCHMTGHLAGVVNFLLLLVLGAVLHRLCTASLRDDGIKGPPPLLYMAAICSVCQWVNLISPFQVQFALQLVFVAASCLTLGMACALPARDRRSLALTGLATLFYLLALFSMATGAFALAPLLLLLALSRADWRKFAVLLVPAGAALWLYFRHFTPASQTPSTAFGLARLGDVLGFWTSFQGGAFIVLGNAVFAMGGMVLVLLGAGLLDMLLRYRRAGAAIPAARAAVLALGGYCAACGAAAAIGRGAAATASALEPRYTIISIVGVVTALTLAARFVPSVRWRRGRPALPWILALLGLLPLWPLNFNEKFETLAMSLHNQLQLDAAALRANIDIDAPMTVIDFAPVASRANTLRFLKDARLTFFGSSFDPPARIAAWFAAMDPATMPPCATGKLHAYGVDPASLVVNGWVADPGRHATAPWVAIKSAAKVLATAASDQPFIVPRRAVRQRPGLAFVAGLADPPPAPLWLLAAYASGKGGCAWQVPQDWAGVLLQPLPPASANAARLGNWPPVLAGGFAAGADPGAHLPPPAGTTDFVSTSKAGDAALGAATLHLDWPKESSQDLLLPVATGPNTANQWLELQFADGKGVAFPMPFFARPNGEWRVLVIRAAMLAAHGGGVTITAHDDGKNWGQWIAIAQPFAGQVNPTAGRLY